MPYTHLLVPTDGSELSVRALDQAIGLARAL
ncbi:MAG: universal stress protein, partial [Synechococcaceae bacterium WBB_10_009]|nr:universal stress protein [Synechococcaceae bacterium WBB_10_009]